MRRLIPVLASLFLIAACSGSAATPAATPAAAPTAASVVAPTAAPTAPPSAANTLSATASPVAATALATYDGKTCTYTGPTVLPEGTRLQIQFAPAAETYAVNWAPVLHGTTLAQIKQDDGANLGPDYEDGTPAWAWMDAAGSSFASGTVPLDLSIYKVGDQSYDGLTIACAKTTPAKSDPTAVNLTDFDTGTLIAIMPK